MIVLLAAAIIGGALGYVQDNLTQSALRFVPWAVYVAGIIAWSAYVWWSAASLLMPSIRWKNAQASRFSLALILIFWLATIIGGTSFFLINGMDYMTLLGVILLSAFIGAAYTFVLVVLPLILIQAVSWIRSRRQSPIPTSN
jgi:hypothetical protein